MSEEKRDYVKEASDDGWVDKDEWKGDPEKHVDAKTFVERGEKISGILKSKIGRLEDRIDSLTQSNAEFKQYTDKQLSKEHDKNKVLIAELEDVKAQAITDGDGAAAVKAEKEIQSLQTEPTNGAVDPELDRLARDWGSTNEWYGSDKELTEYAEFIYPRVLADGYTGKAYYDELTRRVESQHPDKFKNPNRDKAGSVESGGDKEVKDSKAHTWANLPKEAQVAAKRFETDIPGFTREDFVANYEWE